MEVRKEDQRDQDEKVVEIEIERLRGFKNHPFKVQADSQMKELQESIKKYGILNPLIVRPRPEGFYEIISGHRRKYAAQQLKYTKVPVIIRYMLEEDAIISMVDANLQRERISPSEKAFAESISRTAEEVGNKYIKNFSFTSHEIGLLFGNVQSGKTGQMFGIISKAIDLGFPVFVLLTTDNVVLQQQTLDRVKADLDGYCICGENDARIFIDNCLLQPTIIVLKKNARILKLWANIFNSTGFMRGNPLFIVDDEADAASLNTLVNKDRQSSINKYLDIIKNGASSSIYLQVTGTPQAIFLQTIESGWHPYFTYYFQPGESYLGGDFFFPASGKPECIEFLEQIQEPTRSVVVRHIAVASQMLASGGKVANCLFHPSVKQAAHKKYADEVLSEIAWCQENRDAKDIR